MTNSNSKHTIYQIVLAGLFVAMGILLPQVFHMVPNFGKIFLPMHIPVLLCGIICGWKIGGITGFLVPILTSIFTGMPPMPVVIWMTCELVTYGIIAGLLAKKQTVISTYIALIGAMIGGRIVLAISQLSILGFSGKAMPITVFLTGAFVTALPGILIQLILIPLIVMLYNKVVQKKIF